jgi:multidrug efflux pump
MTKPQMYDVASSILAQKVSQVKGVGQVFVGGSSLPAVRLELNPLAVSKYGLSLENLRGVLSSTSVNRPKGTVSAGDRSWEVRANDQLSVARDYLPLVVSYRNGDAVKLADVANVRDSIEDVRTTGLVNGKPAILLIVFRQPGANIIETVDSVTNLLPQLEASLPGAINLSVVLDRSPSIRGSLKDVEFSLIISGLLVVLVVFCFLRNVRATLIPAVAVASSIIGTFAVMYLFGYSLDNLSLMALTISTGFVVDDAIVVLENIIRYLEQGQSPFQAALSGSKEIAFTVLTMSVSLVAVFIPILLMGGIVGRLFREFAVTLSTAIMVSLLISLTATPMMCAMLLKPEGMREHGVFFRTSERMFNWLHSRYEVSLAWALRHSLITLAILLVTLGCNFLLFWNVPKGFFPEQDTGRIMGRIQAAQDISFQAMEQKLTSIVNIIKSDPDVVYVTAFTGGGGGGASTVNTGRMFISLAPFEKRKATANDVIKRLRRKLMSIPGAPAFLAPVQDLQVGGRISNALYQYTLTGADLKELTTWSQRLLQKLYTVHQLADLSSDLQDRGKQAQLVIDRSTASRLGITPQVIDDTLYDAFGQRQISIYYTLLNQYHVIMEVDPVFWQRPDTLRDIYVPTSTGSLAPLSAFTHYERSNTALAVNHQGQFPAITLSFNLAPGVALGDAVLSIEKAARGLGIPGSIQGKFAGTAQAFQASLKNQPFLILAALVSVYLVLGILYESYIHPITILSTLPSAGVGAVTALMLFRTDLSLIAIIGVILLIGLVKKNGIMMVDFAIAAERNEGKSPEEAIYEACLLRFRPIMMTTMAALLGALPLALGTGVGSELRRPLGISIVGGLIFSQMLTLYTTPVVYLYMDRFRLWVAKLRGQRKKTVRA